MSLVIYNVLKRKKELFKPLKDNLVTMYACGITVYDEPHIGHARQAIIYDVIRRYLESLNYKVIYVRNYTDVDDKIIARANELGVDATLYANEQIKLTDQLLLDLGVRPATIEPKASDNIEEMISFIQDLIQKGHAYVASNNDVYFRVDSFSEYGKLSNQDITANLVGVRKDTTEGKANDLDFALWKSAKAGEISWPSPWGNGRPGWHIECSVMSTKFLGNTIDIHGGGKDLIFPHHENEIAQSEAHSGEPFANYWVHNGLIKINGQKMSKSLGNGITVRELLDKYHPEVIRMTLLQFGYRADINIVDGMFEETEKHLYNFYQTLNQVDQLTTNNALIDQLPIKENFDASMEDDFNTGNAISYLYGYFNELNKHPSKILAKEIIDVYQILGLLQSNPQQFINKIHEKYLLINKITEAEINQAIEERAQAKSSKNYQLADQIRDYLLTKNIILMDKPSGVQWQIRIN